MTRRKLKVAQIITLLELGGAQKNTYHILQELDPERFERILICGRGAYLDKEMEKSGFQTFFVNTLVRPVAPLRDLLAIYEISIILRREKPDIVHTNSSKAGIVGRWAARLAGVPVIVHTYHGFGFNREQSFWTRLAFVLVEKITAPISHCLVTVSKANQDEALGRGIGRPEQYRLIRCGVPLSLFRSISPRPNTPIGIPLTPENKLVTTIGPFKPQKNLLDFIEAAALVHEKYPAARFMIVGDGALRPVLEREIERKRLQKVLFLAGWREDIPSIFMRTNIFAMTSLWEGLPLALVEAMGAGLPSVCNAIDGVQDIVSDGINGFLVPPKRPERTAERIIYLLQNPNFALQMGQSAREMVSQEFDIDFMVRQHEKLYEELATAAGLLAKPPVM